MRAKPSRVIRRPSTATFDALGVDQGVDSLDEVGDVEEVAAEGEVVGHHAEPGGADRGAERQQRRPRPRSGRPWRRPARRSSAGALAEAGRRSGSPGRWRRRVRGFGAERFELDAVEPHLGVRSRRCSARPAARRFRRLPGPPCRARRAAGSRRGIRAAPRRPRPPGSALRQRGLQLRDLARRVRRLPGAWGRGPAARRRRRARPRRGSRRSCGWRSSSQPSDRFGGGGGRSPGSGAGAGAASRCAVVAGTGAASKAATIWNWAMKSRVWQLGAAARARRVGAASPPLRPSSEDCTPTRVTPSMSFSAETKPATASWPLAQPTSSSAGPGTDAAQGDAGRAVDRDFGAGRAGEVGQPDVAGQDQREFAHHPLPVEAAVGEAGDGGDPLVADARGTGCRRRARCGARFGRGVLALRAGRLPPCCRRSGCR